MDKNMELPEGWKIVKLADVCKKILGGGTPSTKINEYWRGNIPWISSADIHGLKNVTPRKSITQKAIEDSTANILPKGGIIVVTRVSLGKIAIAPYDITFSQDNQGLILNEQLIDQSYALICLSEAVQVFKHQSRGTTINGVTKKQLVDLEIPLPSLPEQHQIVQKIEELFSELDKGIENLKTAQQQLKVYRQAVLKWAFEGRLTNDNVKDGELPEGWEWKKLNQVCTKIQDGSHFSPKIQYDEPGENRYMYITAKNIRNNYMDFRKLYFVDEEYHNSIYPRCNPEFGDVLLTKDGINTGEVTLNTLKEPFSMLSSVCLFKPKANVLTSEILKYFIQSPFGNRIILKSMTGTAIKRIVLRKIKDAEISLPPFDEQLKLIQEIESRLSVCDKIEETITTSLQQAEALRQSILKKAFEGKLLKEDRQTLQAEISEALSATLN